MEGQLWQLSGQQPRHKGRWVSRTFPNKAPLRSLSQRKRSVDEQPRGEHLRSVGRLADA